MIAERRSVMFSPIVAIAPFSVSSTVAPSFSFAALIAARLPSVASAASAMRATRLWKSAFRATKSVSELTSTMTALPGAVATPTRPSAATRPAFLAALARPLARSQSTAASMSPPVSVSAFLQSIMPTPVFSRSSFTIPAEIAISLSSDHSAPTRLFAWPTQSSLVMRPLKLSASSIFSISSSERFAIWASLVTPRS